MEAWSRHLLNAECECIGAAAAGIKIVFARCRTRMMSEKTKGVLAIFASLAVFFGVLLFYHPKPSISPKFMTAAVRAFDSIKDAESKAPTGGSAYTLSLSAARDALRDVRLTPKNDRESAVGIALKQYLLAVEAYGSRLDAYPNRKVPEVISYDAGLAQVRSARLRTTHAIYDRATR